MAVEPISIRQMEKQTADIYEAVAIMTQRARQIAQNRAAEKMLDDMEEFNSDSMDFMVEEDNQTYEEQEKPTTQAINEFMEGDLSWRNLSDE
ncbi:MAG: DNA-directed RNA polymerase subunit omega [Candidatus Marinimicrobia bacterium]|nr:DNA-directed RNA polymerase subunit omega [Candidatus Neomarinimicrobiota bacterium]